MRQRSRLIRSFTAEIQHIQKALQQMNLKLTQVLSDVSGATGLAIIRDIVASKRIPTSWPPIAIRTAARARRRSPPP